MAKTGQRDADWRKKGLSYLVLFSGWYLLRKLRKTLARRTPPPPGMEVPRGTGQRGAPRMWPAEGNADLAPRPCLSTSTRVFPPGSESRVQASWGGRDPLRVGRAGGDGQAGGWQPTVFCFLTPDMLWLWRSPDPGRRDVDGGGGCGAPGKEV